MEIDDLAQKKDLSTAEMGEVQGGIAPLPSPHPQDHISTATSLLSISNEPVYKSTNPLSISNEPVYRPKQ